MYQVGTQAGVVNKQRQGTGLATVLQDTEQADDYFMKYMGARAEAAQKKAADKEVAKNAALGKIMAVNPDFFYKHQKEMADQVAKTQQLGVAAMQSGAADPAVGADPASQEYQKELNRLNQMSQVSVQVRDQFKAFQQDVQAKGADYFDPETIVSWDGYANTSLSERMENPLSPPVVKQRQPYKDALVMAGTLAETISKGVQDGAQVDPATMRRTVREFFSDAKDGAVNTKSAAETYSNLPDARKQELADRAVQHGISAPEQMMFEMVDAQIKDPNPYNPAEALANAKLDVSEFARTGAETFESGTSESKTRPAALSEANRLMNEKPDAFPAWARYYGMEQGKGQSEKEFRTEVQRKLATDLWDRAKKEYRSGVVSGSGSSPEQKKRTDDWLETIYGQDMTAAQQAIDMLRGVDYGQGFTIDNAQVISDVITTTKGPMGALNGKIVRLEIASDVKAKFSKDDIAMAMGVNPAEVNVGKEVRLESGQVVRDVTITLRPENAGYLKTLYEDSEKKGRRWDKSAMPTYGTPATVEEALGSQTPAVKFGSQQPKSTPKYNYKGK